MSKIIVAGIAGTTAFTLFSYLVSEKMHKDFEEPELLGKMLDRALPAMTEKQTKFTGWLIHYLVGHAFATVYNSLAHNDSSKFTIKNGLLAGAITGIPAAIIWDTTLKFHPVPPRSRSMNYYFHLAIGHTIFGAVTFYMLGRLSNKSSCA